MAAGGRVAVMLREVTGEWQSRIGVRILMPAAQQLDIIQCSM